MTILRTLSGLLALGFLLAAIWIGSPDHWTLAGQLCGTAVIFLIIWIIWKVWDYQND